MGHTRREYSAFERAYDYFNEALFKGELPGCLITLQRKAHSCGYFCSQRFAGRVLELRNGLVDEIALNPDTFAGQTDIEILSTLVHEMVHLWQFHNGKPSRSTYHNAEWADRMESLGLMPSHTGLPGGKRTGNKMADYIIPDGRFAKEVAKLLETGFRLLWEGKITAEAGGAVPGGTEISMKKETKPSKVKYSCPVCRVNAWAKPGIEFDCHGCKQLMLSEGAIASLLTQSIQS